jgi:hypothetical protein
MANLRDLLRIEEIISHLCTAPDSVEDDGVFHFTDFASLIARAGESISLLEECCRDHRLMVDFAKVNEMRRLSLPNNHPYKILLPYFSPAGVAQFADFRGYWVSSDDYDDTASECCDDSDDSDYDNINSDVGDDSSVDMGSIWSFLTR